MKLVDEKTVYTLVLTETDRYFLIGLLGKVIFKENLNLESDAEEKVKDILKYLCRQ